MRTYIEIVHNENLCIIKTYIELVDMRKYVGPISSCIFILKTITCIYVS